MALVSLENLTCTYRGADAPSLTVDKLLLEPGEILLVLGASGSGKSTLCRALCGFLTHFYHGELDGLIEICGKDPREAAMLEMIQCAGMVFQRPEAQITGTKFTVKEEIACGPENLGFDHDMLVDRVNEAMHSTGLSELADRSPFSLSGGEKQRLALASILSIGPKLLVLDEAMSQLDPLAQQDILHILKKLAASGRGIVLTATSPGTLTDVADKVAVMGNGGLTLVDDVRNAFASKLLPDNHIARPTCMETALKARSEGLWPQSRPLPATMAEACDTLTLMIKGNTHGS